MTTDPVGASAGVPRDIAFLFLGGIHQALHMAPVAVALARGGHAVTAYVPPVDAALLAALFAALDAAAARRIALVPLTPRLPSRLVAALTGGGGGKTAMLIEWRRRLIGHEALVVAERTSTLLKRWPGRRPFMIHIPHGAGDRARGFDPRVRFFDQVLVNGPTVYARTLAQGSAGAGNCRIIGSVKLGALAALHRDAARLFADDRPVLLYNPHFDTALSSWPLARDLAAAIVAAGRFNLIVAPHMRLQERLDAAERDWWRQFGDRDGVIVDWGSERSWNMAYAEAADLYLGDVSSQVYEFLHRPRPVVFVEAHGNAWRDNPDYAMFAMGEVATDVAGAVAALDRAAARHPEFSERQETMVAAMLGPVDPGVPERAAATLLATLPPASRPSRPPVE